MAQIRESDSSASRDETALILADRVESSRVESSPVVMIVEGEVGAGLGLVRLQRQFAVGLALATLLSLCCLLSCEAQSTLNVSNEIASSFPTRYYANCAQSSTNVFLIGGYANSTHYCDVWASAATATGSIPAPFQEISNPSGNYIQRYNGGSAALVSNVLLQWGGVVQVNVQTDNSVYYSTDGGFSWQISTANPGWSPRQGFAYCVFPSTSLVVMAGGQPAPAQSSTDIWASNDGIGAVWSRQNANTPFGKVNGAAMIATYAPDSTLILVGGDSSGGATTPTLTNTVYASGDIGVTWSIVSSTPPFSPRFYHSLSVDSTNLVVLVGGTDGTNTTLPLDAYISSDAGATWIALVLSNPPQRFWAQCSFFLPSSSSNIRALILYSGVNSLGFGTQVHIAALSTNLAFNSTGRPTHTLPACAGNCSTSGRNPTPFIAGGSSSTAASATGATNQTSSGPGSNPSSVTSVPPNNVSSSSGASGQGGGNAANRASPATLVFFLLLTVSLLVNTHVSRL